MIKLTIDWKNGPVWPGTMTTTEFMLLQGANLDNIKYGLSLIRVLIVGNPEFIKPSPEEEASGLSWRTILNTEDYAAPLLMDYFENRMIAEANAIGYNVTVTQETIQ